MRKILTILICTIAFTSLKAQKVNVAGVVQDTIQQGLAYTTVCLLSPEDSTLKYFALTNEIGGFILKDVEANNYLLQINRLGYVNHYQNIATEQLKNDLTLGNIELKEYVYNLNGVNIYGEQAAVMIKNDTVEYNAKSFKTQTTDNVENLLKKLPGVEVDRDGNIKAQGEQVQKVMVDGKEFFGNNPKMATKNLNAKAIDKVQVYDKKSDLAEFTGDDDGETQKVINLQLKEDHKTGGFGEATAGIGTDNRYQGKANYNRFSEKSQLSLLGSVNNINQFGMGIDEFVNFNGGLSNLMRGGQVEVSIDGNSPINTGQSQPGDLTSGYVGGNINIEPTKKLKINANYLGDAKWQNTIENSVSQQFVSGNTFDQIANSIDNLDRINHNANTRIEANPDSLNRFIVNASGGLSTTDNTSQSEQQNFDSEETLINQLNANTSANNQSTNATVQANYIKKSGTKKGNYLNLELGLEYSDSQLEQNWNNTNITAPTYNPLNYFTKRQDINQNNTFSGEIRYNFKLTDKFNIRPEVDVRQLGKQLQRGQDFNVDNNPNTNFNNSVKQNILSTDLGTSFRWHLDKWNITTTLSGNNIQYQTDVFLPNNTNDDFGFNKWYFTPSVNARYKFSRFKSIRLRYNTGLNSPSLNQANSFVDASNQQRITQGNIALTPEYNHSLSGSLRLYDAFSFTSFYASLSANHTDNKITQVINTDTTLTQFVSYQNFKNQQSASVNTGFNTPIRKLGIKIDASLSESISKGYSLVDGVENVLNTYNHGIGLSIENRKKEKFDWRIGTDFSITQARYSLNTRQNTNYFSQSYFTDLVYFINEDFSVGLSFDYTEYKNSQLDKSTFIPMLKANASYTFLPKKNATLTLDAFDLLDQNKIVNQYSVNNLIGETSTNVIQQYFMLSFTYKINSQNNQGPDLGKMHRRMR